MSAIPHILNIFRKPKQAISGTYSSPVLSDYQEAQYVAFAYEHTKLAIGGDDNARCTLSVDPLEADYIYWNYVGNRATITVDNPVYPIFEGYIESVSIAQGAVKRVRSIAEMANRISVTYYAGSSAQTTMNSSATSIATYGAKEKTFDAGNKNAAGAGFAAALAGRKLADLASPPETFSPNSGSGYSVDITIKGFYHTWDWQSNEVSNTTYPALPAPNPPATSEDAITCIYRHILGANSGIAYSFASQNSSDVSGNGNGVFYNDLDLTRLTTSTVGWTRTKERKGGQTTWQYLQETVQAGDGVNRYVIGIAPTDFSTGYRKAYYLPANTDVEYTTDPQGTSRVFDVYGQPLRAWTVQPDRQIMIADSSIGRSFAGTNTKYISKVQYKAESQEVTWATELDLSLDGVLQVGNYTKSTDSLFGAPKKQFY
ncbi:hypothetical protein KC887_02455 [Candidatus Kaiserbacteria bacterium]|nr:hypothetical protein [Candidatus Kaiserbacteria bacterium]